MPLSWGTYANHFFRHINIEQLWCTRETNTILYVSCILIKIFFKKERKKLFLQLPADSPPLSPTLRTGSAKGSHLFQGYAPFPRHCIQRLTSAGVCRSCPLASIRDTSEGPSQLLSCPDFRLRSPRRPRCSSASPFAHACFRTLLSS